MQYILIIYILLMAVYSHVRIDHIDEAATAFREKSRAKSTQSKQVCERPIENFWQFEFAINMEG